MRLTVHWRGKPLVAVDMAAHSPEDPAPEGTAIEAAGHLQDSSRADAAEPDTRVFGFGGPRPES